MRERIDADEAIASAASGVDATDVSLLGALVFGAMRWHHRLLPQCDRLLSKPLRQGQLELGALLRIGLLQLQHLRVPEHAAVSATVDAAKLLGQADAAPLVNAVLRRFQRERAAIDAALADVPEARFSHPAWLIDALARDWPDAWQTLLEANNAQAPMWLRVNERRGSREAYLEMLRASGIGATAAADVATAIALDAPRPVDSLPGFAAGYVSVQDIAAQRAAGFLELASGQRVLDACAAPGGKTGHILETCTELAEVWAVDRDEARLAKVRENLDRLGLAARVIAGDATRPADWWDGRPFDRILLDAPCSGTGVIRRHPDIKVLRRPEDVTRAAQLQSDLLRALWPLVRPGGRLVYATCSVLRRENDAQIEAFQRSQPDEGPGTVVARRCQTLPGETNGDGFYYACLHKPDTLRSPHVPSAQQKVLADG
jgi:16S rRNA (cytosine967-C5)-methyltransferase